VKVYPFEYDLVLRPDINTRGHTQWFYFAVANTRAGCRYKLNLINLLKEDSLHNVGLQVCRERLAGGPPACRGMHERKKERPTPVARRAVRGPLQARATEGDTRKPQTPPLRNA
jgi:hypothetical protein